MNTQLKTFKTSDLKRAINKEYGSQAKFKAYLKRIAKNQYDCYTAEVKVYGCRIIYTSNPNCFASYLVSIPMVGMSSQMALDRDSITKAGHLRSCTKYCLQ